MTFKTKTKADPRGNDCREQDTKVKDVQNYIVPSHYQTIKLCLVRSSPNQSLLKTLIPNPNQEKKTAKDKITKRRKKKNEPHATTILEGIRPTLKRTIKMTMNLMLPFPTLIQQRQLEQRPNIGPIASQRDEDGDVGGVILGVLAVGVEVDSPLVPADGESIAGDVFPDPDSFGERVAFDREAVGSVYGLRHRERGRRRW